MQIMGQMIERQQALIVASCSSGTKQSYVFNIYYLLRMQKSDISKTETLFEEGGPGNVYEL